MPALAHLRPDADPTSAASPYVDAGEITTFCRAQRDIKRGLMLCGATQRSCTNPADKTSPAIPIGPRWMITWTFDAPANGLPTAVRNKGAWAMFSGTPYSHLHICGTQWEGIEYHEGDKAVWTMS
jgi:hypothetical protein